MAGSLPGGTSGNAVAQALRRGPPRATDRCGRRLPGTPPRRQRAANAVHNARSWPSLVFRAVGETIADDLVRRCPDREVLADGRLPDAVPETRRWREAGGG